MRRWAVAKLLLPVVATTLLLAACAPSVESLEDAVKDKPGVLRVKAGEHGGDDRLPFEKVAKHVDIRMAADATAAQIMAVFDEFDDEVVDGDVYSITVVLRRPKRATLALGEGIHATESMVQDLVKAQHDDGITEYLREAFPVLPSVYLTVVPMAFDDVVAVVDRYRVVDDIESVNVVSGGFILSRDVGNGDPRLYEARERFVHQVNMRFRLTGALVDGRGPVRLAVDPADVAAVRSFADQNASTRSLGRIVVSTKVRIPT